MKLLLLDNYDSFTYNLLHALEPLVDEVDVVLNDQFDLENLTNYDGIVLSPGPGLPKNAGAMPDLIRHAHRSIPILGICLGMQGIAEFFGGRLVNLENVIHGRPQICNVIKSNDKLYRNLPGTLEVGHYHSWIVTDLPGSLQVTAIHPDGWPLSFSHCDYPVCGVQFHPESVMTPNGTEILKNWVDSLPSSEGETVEMALSGQK